MIDYKSIYRQYLSFFKRSLHGILRIAIPLLFFISNNVWSQTYPIQASLFITPPYSVYLSDYTSAGGTRLSLSIFLADLSRPDLDIRFRLLIEGSGIEIRTKQGFIGSRYKLISGTPTQFYGEDLQEYFELQNLELSGISRSQLERTGALPEGIYRFTIEVLEYNRGVRISNPARSTAWLILNDPPIINLPLDNEVVIAADPQTVRFQWTPRHKGSPNASFSTEYLLKIVEIWPEGRNPNDAINTSNSIFEKVTSNNYFVYSLAEPPLIPGKKYAFQVQARAQVGIDQLDLFKNNGYSVVRSFTFGESCNPPIQITSESSGNSFINIIWEPRSTNTAFSIRFKEDIDGSNWYDKFSYLPNIRMDKLKPGTSYQVLVQAMCGTLVSEESSPVIFSTSNNQSDFSCGEIEVGYNLENTTPIDKLIINDYIYAGDFDIKLDSIGRSGNKFSGTGIASFPFLNFVKTKVRFEDINVNSDYRMFAGTITSIYDPFSAMMYNTNQDEYETLESSETGIEGDSIQSETNPGTGESSSEIDSLYTNDAGEIIIVVNGEEKVIQPPADGEELKFIDSNGIQITVNSDGAVQRTSTSVPGATDTTNQSHQDGLRFTFGPLVVTIHEEKEPIQTGDDCLYDEVQVSLELVMEDQNIGIVKTISLESAIFTYTKNCATGELISANINWLSEEGKEVGEISEIDASVFNLMLEIDSEGNIEGDIEFYAHLSNDKPLTDLAVLRAGLSGSFKYTFSNSNSNYSGSFNFKGVENINLDLVKQNQIIASLENGSLDEQGVLRGKVRLLEEINYQTSQFSVKIKKLVFDIIYGVGHEFLIESGTSTLIISGMNMIQGEVKVLVEVENNIVSAAVESNELIAFGMQLNDLNLTINLNSALNFTTLNGNMIATHPNFSGVIDVNEVRIENGKITILNLSGEVNYLDLQVIIQQANYNDASKSIILSAYVEIESDGVQIAAEIEDFSIDQLGKITWGGYNVSVDGIKTFGPLTVAITAETSESNGSTYRATTAKASLSLNIEGTDNQAITIVDAEISYLKHKSKERYKEIKITIDEVGINAPDLGPLQAQLNKFHIEIDTNEKYLTGKEEDAVYAKLSNNSYIQFNIGLNEDLNLGRLLVIESGVSGSITYNFSGEGLNGDLNYQNVENLNIIAKKDEAVLASMTNVKILENGVVSGTLNALTGSSFRTGGLTLEVQELTLDVIVPFKENFLDTRIISGHGKLKAINIGELDGSLILEIDIDELSNISAQVSNTSVISAFGMALSEFDLQVEVLPDFQIKSIKGQLAAAHPQFDAALTVSEFSIEDGKLQAFNFEGKVAYHGFNLDLQKVEYRAKSLIIDGKVAINVSGSAAWLAIEELVITDDGTITLRGVEGELDKSPVYIAFTASMESARFTGSFTGELSGIGLEGKIDIGVENKQYNYAYLELLAQGNIPLAGTGLKLTKLGGQFGYNYALIYEQAGQPPSGSPQEGNYVVGLTLGVADMSNMLEVSGNTVVQFGNDKFDLNLNGTISIPKENSIATGSLNVHYVLPDNTLNGSIGLDINVPPETGRLMTGNFNMNYAMGNNEWSVSTTNISAKLFSEVDFIGNISLAGQGDGGKFSGILSGYSSYDFTFRNEFEAFGANLIAELNAGFNFQGEIAFDDTGAEGEVSLYLYANGELGIETLIGGYNTLIGLNGSSLALLKFNRDNASLVGKMNVVVYFLGFENEVDVNIEQQI